MLLVEHRGIFFPIIPFGEMTDVGLCEGKQYNTQAVAYLKTKEGTLFSVLIFSF